MATVRSQSGQKNDTGTKKNPKQNPGKDTKKQFKVVGVSKNTVSSRGFKGFIPYEHIVEKQIPKIDNAMAVVEYIKVNHIDFVYFNHLRNIVTLPDQTISDWLHISTKTFASYRTQGGTSPKENTQEQALMIIALYKHAEEVFDSNDDFSKWLDTSNFFFDNKKPQELLGTISGIKYIDDRLTAMEYGDNV